MTTMIKCLVRLLAVSAVAGMVTAAAAGNATATAAPTSPIARSELEASPFTTVEGKAHAAEHFGQLPLFFERNQGQTDARVAYWARAGRYRLFLTPTEAVIDLRQPHTASAPVASSGGASGAVLRTQFIGANPHARIRGEEQLPGVSHYVVGTHANRWTRDVAQYGEVRYENLYPNIDLVYRGNGQHLEYDFVVAPGGDPRAIRLSYRGARHLTLDSGGNLHIDTAAGELVEHVPTLFQTVNGHRRPVSGGFRIHGTQELRFEVDRYDVRQALTIDPEIDYSSPLGGSDFDNAYAVAVNAAGEVYICGDTGSSDFPLKNPLPLQFPHGDLDPADAFVAKLSADGRTLLYSTFIGGSQHDLAMSIALDAAGHIYLGGVTASPDFPMVNAVQPTYGGSSNGSGPAIYGGDGFVTELSSDGSHILFSTYLGGAQDDNVGRIALDAQNNIYVTGATQSTDFPTQHALQPNLKGASDAIVAKFSPGGASLIYSTYLGGSFYNGGVGLGVESDGSAVVAGFTSSKDFPVTNPALFPTYPGGVTAAFISKLAPDGSRLSFSTYLGGHDNTGGAQASNLALDSHGDIYVTGYTISLDFPAFPMPAPTYREPYPFITKISGDGSKMIYSDFFGGTAGYQFATGIGVDAQGNAYIAGYTSSSDYPEIGSFVDLNSVVGDVDAFVTAIDPTGSRFLYSTFLGGAGFDQALGMTVDHQGNVYVVGTTLSGDFPTVNAVQPANAGNYDAFIAKIRPDSDIHFSSTDYSVTPSAAAATITAVRTGSATGAVSVDYAATNGTARSGHDYVATSGTLTWADGVTSAKTFTVKLAATVVADKMPTIELNLRSPANSGQIEAANAVLTVMPDPPPSGSGGGGAFDFGVIIGLGLLSTIRRRLGRH